MNKEISLDERIEKLFESGWLNEFNYLENQLQEARYLVCVLQKENQQLKKQKDDVVEGLKDLRQFVYDELVDFNVIGATETHCKVMNLLRILGEIE